MLMVHVVKRFWRRLNVAEQEVIIEEAQPSDAKVLIDLLNQVNAETDFIILEKDLSINIGDFLTIICAFGYALHIFFTGES